MTIRCPSCDAVFRRPAGAGSGTAFRCSSCGHVFVDDPEPERIALDEAVDDTGDEDGAAADGDPDGDPGEPPRHARPGAARFALRAGLAMTLVFGLLSIYLYMHRGRLTEVLARVPLLGPDLTATRLQPADVQLTDIRGEFRRVGGDALAFVITGTAVNNAPVPVSAIQIEGRIVGSQERRRLVFAGTAPHDVRELSDREIDLLQTLEPPHDWRLKPGEDGDFLVAFVDPPMPLREFRVEVASVQQRRPAARVE